MTEQCPVPYTCPTIDDIIASAEKVRTANEELRAWGEDMADQLDTAQDRIYELERELESTSDELSTVERDLRIAESEIESLTAELQEAKQ